MKVLIACEFSGIVREAFKAKGHDALSCDLMDSEIQGDHYKGDVMDIINDGWDLMIGHPPCTYLSYAGMSSWNNKGRVFERIKALEFFAKLWESDIEKICLENPKGCASPTISKYSQEIQPYYFGDHHVKTTWLWLKNLPLLKYKTHDDLFGQKSVLTKPDPLSVDNTPRNKKRYYVDFNRSQKQRSRFWPGIAKAMADQWG